MDIIPQPQKQEFSGGEIRVEKIKVVSEYQFVKEYISSYAKESDSGVTVRFEKDDNLAREEYYINISDEIVIKSRDEEGAFRACATLKQLLSDVTVKKQVIHDFPDVKNRGVMIDISRGKIPKLKTLLNIVDILRDVKYNQIQLYADGIVFEYKSFLKYCEDVMTLEELRIFIDYCKKNFIMAVPNQNGFGHMEKWLVKPELRSLGIERDDGRVIDTLNPLNPDSLNFVNTLYGDILPVFDSDIVNVGMDETFSLGMGQTKEICEKVGTSKVYFEYLNKIIRLANKEYKKKPMFWDDIVFKYPDMLDTIDKNCIFMDWNYESDPHFSERCRLLNKLGFEYYVCPGTSTWCSFTGRFENMILNVEDAARACILYNGSGFLLTDWGDGGNPQFLAMSILPYLYGACCSWNFKAKEENETSYNSYHKVEYIVKKIEEYADRFIFMNKGFARLVHRMANYYLLENHPKFNETYMWNDLEALSSGEDTPTWRNNQLEADDVSNVLFYLTRIFDAVKSIPNENPYAAETKCNCRMVMLIAEFILERLKNQDTKIKNEKLKSELISFKQEFTDCWNEKNRKNGSQIFIGKIDKMLLKFE